MSETLTEAEREALAAVLSDHLDASFTLHGEAGPGWYCTCREPYAGHEPYDPKAYSMHLARTLLASDWLAEYVAARTADLRARLAAAEARHDVKALAEELVDITLSYQGQGVGGPHAAIIERLARAGVR